MTLYRLPYHLVTVNSTPLTDVLSARVQLGFDKRVATADVECRSLPAGIAPWDVVQITLGGTQATAHVRFTGYFVSHEEQLYEHTVKLNCKGYLQRADQSPYDTEVDMSSRGDGHKDEVMVSTVLSACGLTGTWTPSGESAYTGIEGTGRMLGLYSWERGFAIRAGETAMSFIERLDAVCAHIGGGGYRTFDTASGAIVRQVVTSIPTGSPAWTFTEGVDIFRATATTTVLEAKNQVVTTGFPGWDGKTVITYTATGSNPYLITNATQRISSNMIEKQNTTDTHAAPYTMASGDGLSCQMVANWQLAELNRRMVKLPLTTPRSDAFAPNDLIQVDAPTRLGLTTQLFWVQGVDTNLTRNNTFSQVLNCIGSYPLPPS
jgi:hypothetical protein